MRTRELKRIRKEKNRKRRLEIARKIIEKRVIEKWNRASNRRKL